MTYGKPLYSIVVPVYRSAKTLVELYERMDRTFAGLEAEYELILVEDAGGDGSWEVMQSLRQRDPRVKIIRLVRNYGQHNALMCGFSFASGDYAITIDDDLQNPPEEIPKLIEAITAKNLDLVFGIPREKKHSRLRNWCSRIFSRAVLPSATRSTPIRISNVQIMKKQIVEHILQFHTPHPIVALLALQVAEKTGMVTVDHHERLNGQSTYNLRILLRQFLHGLIYHSELPLKCLLLLGLSSIGLSLGMGVYYGLRPETAVTAETGWKWVFILLPLFSGFIILSLWLAMEYLHRLLQGLYSGPQYLIREKDL